MKKTEITDSELDKLLHQVPQAPLPAGFESRLLGRLQQSAVAPQHSNVIAFPARTARRGFVPWLAALPLAASLAAGIFLGAQGEVPDFLSTSTYSSVASTDDDGVSSGVDEVEAYAEDGVT